MSLEHFGPYSVELTRTAKVLFPESGISKGDLISYYREVSPVMLPHLENRPLMLHRFPDGIGEDGFYQQQLGDYFPDWIQTCSTPRAGDAEGVGPVEHVLCNNEATLVYLANQAAITLHGWLSRAPRISRADRLIFDLDPPDGDFARVRRAARRIVDLMERIGLTPFVMTTGSRGLHVVAPLRNDADFEEVRSLARAMADHLARQYPHQLTLEQRKNKREGRIYLDIMRNAYGQTTVMPYAVRAKPGAPVATPIDLSELGDSRLDPQRWKLGNILRRLAQKDDPWRKIRRCALDPGRAREALEQLTEGGGGQ